MLTVSELTQVLPPHLRTAASQALADRVNTISSDPEMLDLIRNNFISYTHVLREGRFKTEDYLNAVAYVSHKMMGCTNKESYKRTFPDRYMALVMKGTSDKDISCHIVAYNKNKMVNLILEQTLIPSWVLNQDIYQRAINTQAELMLGAKSEKVRSDAANSLLTHLKKPETKQMELAITVDESSGMTELKNMLSSLAQRQQDLIGQGVTTKEIAHQKFGASLGSPKGEVIDAVLVKDASPASVTAAPAPKQVTPKQLGKSPLTSFKPGA